MIPIIYLLYVYIISVILTLGVWTILKIYKIIPWSFGESLLMLVISFLPIFNYYVLYHGTIDIIKFFQNVSEKRKEQDLQKEQEVFKILDKIDIKYIERYLRKKKLKKIK